jgi:orotidine-5'-phosphate decarboxylase
VDQLLVALDVPTAETALGLADRLRGVVGGFKIGSHLFTAGGPPVLRTLAARGDRVFLDLKFHDIPNTVAAAVAAATSHGAWMINVHASGGAAMMRAAAESAARAAAAADRPPPLLIAVTVLTSLDAESLGETGVGGPVDDQVVRLARLAQSAGLDGVVASPREAPLVRQACGGGFAIVTPGIRGGAAAAGPDDQARTTTARAAIAAGASYIVVGRPIIGAPDPREAAERIAAEARTATSP